MKEAILETFNDEKLVFLRSNFDSAILGVDVNTMRIIYSSKKIKQFIHKNKIEIYNNILESNPIDKTKKPIICDDSNIIKNEYYPEYDSAIFGVDTFTKRIVYSKKLYIEILAHDMEYEEALEFFEYNIGCAYYGENTPIYCDDTFIDD